MKKNKKEQWMLDFEKALKEFDNTKWSKMTDSQIKSANGGALSPKRYDSEYQREMSKRGAVKGATTSEANQREKYGDEYNNVMKSRLYDNIKNKKAFHSKGAKTSGKHLSVRSCGSIIKGAGTIGLHKKTCKCKCTLLVKPGDERYDEVISKYNEIKKIQNATKVPANKQKWELPNGKITSTPWLNRICKKYGFKKEDCKRIL